MPETIQVEGLIPASPEQVFAAFCDGAQHSAMTGGEATDARARGQRFTAWDGYIEGRVLELEPPRRIRQAGRSSDFPEGAEDSDCLARVA